ncbi:FG-GAP repeat protein [Streptomyces amakusaensis]|uniref:FG-GAP-like repeat-containing protein n=1 Tax=Streptomyces amakusaensis TaxID=67271 RepID=A0ABW0AL90_9ACTN
MNTRSTTRGLGLLTAIAAVAALTAPVAFAAPATAAAPAAAKKAKGKSRDDFNGDGYQDLAVAAPRATVDGQERAGYVAVLYGSKSGLKTSGKQVLRQGRGGIPGVPQESDEFGGTLASADLDRDGYADLVIGAVGDGYQPDPGAAGELTVVWGSAKGLGRGKTPAGTTRGSAEKGSTTRLVAGDFNGDGKPDLAAANWNSGLTVLHGPFDAAAKPARKTYVPAADQEINRSSFALAAGDVNKDGRTDILGIAETSDVERPGVLFWKGTTKGPAASEIVKDSKGKPLVGMSVAVGDVNKDGFQDVLVGNSASGDLDPKRRGGTVTYLPGSAKGVSGAKSSVFHLDTPGIPGGPKDDGGFGASVAVGDLDGDKYGDTVIGVPRRYADGRVESGSVVVLRGTRSGPTAAKAKEFTQNTPGVPGSSETRDYFGSHTKPFDADGDGRNELAVSATGENKGAGEVWVLPATASGPTGKGSLTVNPTMLGVNPDVWGKFGSSYTR